MVSKTLLRVGLAVLSVFLGACTGCSGDSDSPPSETSGLPTIGPAAVRAAYSYADTDEADVEWLRQQCINTLIIKGGYENNDDYSAEPDGVPESVRRYAAQARQLDMRFF